MNSEPRLSSSSSTTFQRRAGESARMARAEEPGARTTGVEAGSVSSASSRRWFALASRVA